MHNRKSIRLKGYDYSQNGMYFVTICTKNRINLFGKIVNGEMILNEIGKIIKTNWNEIKNDFNNICLIDFIIMPDHLHGIIEIQNQYNNCRDLINQIPTDENNWILMQNDKLVLGKIIRHFKAKSSKQIHDHGYIEFQWQSGYYDRIIRNEIELNNVRKYIRNNPLKWELKNNVGV